MNAADFRTRYRGVMASLNHAFGVADEPAFEALVGELYAERDLTLRTGIAKLSQSLANALTRFQLDPRVASLAEREIPDARLRLDHVLKMTEEAVHRTLDLIEQAAPLAEATTHGARVLADTLNDRSHNDIRRFLGEVQENAERVRANLSEVMLAQGFQDLTGQILHGVRTLIGEVQSVLDDLAQISGVKPPAAVAPNNSVPSGPAVPGVTTGAVVDQQDVDNLIAGAGHMKSARARGSKRIRASKPVSPAVPAPARASDPAPAPAPEPAPRRAGLKLETSCTLRDALDMQFQLLAVDFGESEVLLDGSAVENIDTAGLQMLVAFARHHSARDRRIQWAAASPELLRCSRLLGLTNVLGLEDMPGAGADSGH